MKHATISRLRQAVLCGLLLCGATRAATLPDASWDNLPPWQGFNLLDKFSRGWQEKPFEENDFRWISQWGFNFVRLPMDYRQWIIDGDWTRLNESVLQEIDQAVRWGGQYNIHVCINFHRAPGYTVAKPAEAKSLWTDTEAQRVCAMHWAAFAKRYKGIANRNLSFNLLNEPSDVDAAVHAKVITLLVEAIRKEDPDRLIIVDGLDWASKPCPELASLKIAQATRGYQPFPLTHYQAEWVNSAGWPMPQWPQVQGLSGYLYGPGKQLLRSAVQIHANLPSPMTLRMHLATVSTNGRLVVRCGDKMLFDKTLTTGPGRGPWKQSEYKSEWNIYQCLYDCDYRVALPAGRYLLEIDNTEGDWLTLSEIAIADAGGKEYTVAAAGQWGQKNSPLTFDPAGKGGFSSDEQLGGQRLWNESVLPWMEFKRTAGVMVGEWGAYSKTPHDVVLRWMEDCLKNYQKADIGWALWNFRGAFGILDSGRSDVVYEDFEGHKLDRKMLELLQRY